MTENANADQAMVTFPAGSEPEGSAAVRQGLESLRGRALRLNTLRRATDDALANVTPLPPGLSRIEIAGDDGLITAAKAAVEQEQREFLSGMTLSGPGAGPAGSPTLGSGDGPPGITHTLFRPPFHYDWQWQNGMWPIENTSDHATGQIKVSVLAQRHIDAHAGVGVSIHADQDQWVIAGSTRSSWEMCRVWSGSTGAVALCEGGMEMTVLEGPTLLQVAQDKRFRIRLNPGFWAGPENGSHDSGGYGYGANIEVRWFMQAGHTYQVNVGAWVLAEWTDGPHASGDIASANGSVAANTFAIYLRTE